MRASLESEHASLNMHSWIDQIFGVDQRREDIGNVFADICYSDSKIVEEAKQARLERLLKADTQNLEQYFKKDVHLSRGHSMRLQAIDLQMYQFGRVPKRIFNFTHPKIRIKSMFNKKGIFLRGLKHRK